MIPILPVLLKDFYKVGHVAQYPKKTTLVYSNFTPRGTRRETNPMTEGPGIERGIIAFGFQYLMKEYFQRQFEENFFNCGRGHVVKEYKRIADACLGPGTDVSHIGELHEVGYLPLLVKAVPEGTLVPYRVPALTIRNTQPEFGWLTNMLETLLSLVLWKPMTSATTAFYMRRVFEKYAALTGAPKDFVKWQGHDFSMRGMSGIEDACLSASGHLLSYTGTDTIPAVPFLENYYGADCTKELVGGSVPATEHSVMCMGQEEGELATIRRLITEIYPDKIASIVCDTWDFWKVLTDYLPQLREVVLAREGKVVIRPDSGDPVKIICGDPSGETEAEQKGAIRILFEVFGGVRNGRGYIELDPHIGLIYGDSITPERQRNILEGLMANGFASSNVVLGVGSYTYEYVTRDTDGWAMKATYGEIEGVGRSIFKTPKTDDGLKNSARGLLRVEQNPIRLIENCSWEEEAGGLLHPIFHDGVVDNFQSLSDIRARIEDQL